MNINHKSYFLFRPWSSINDLPKIFFVVLFKYHKIYCTFSTAIYYSCFKVPLITNKNHDLWIMHYKNILLHFSNLHHTILIEILAIVGIIVAVAGYRFIKVINLILNFFSLIDNLYNYIFTSSIPFLYLITRGNPYYI